MGAKGSALWERVKWRTMTNGRSVEVLFVVSTFFSSVDVGKKKESCLVGPGVLALLPVLGAMDDRVVVEARPGMWGRELAR